MKLYDRDYNILTEEEKRDYYNILGMEKINADGKRRRYGKRIMFREYPKAARHYEKLFPNNYLDIVELKDIEKLRLLNEEFCTVLNSECNEREILNFIRKNKAYFIIGSIFKGYTFGHHDAYIFPEFQLGTEYKADYLLIGKNSGGYEFIFVELEDPNGNITKKNGNIGEAFRKGIDQTKDWKRWLEKNYQSLREVFKKHMKDRERLPNEFIEYDSTRFHYVVIAGRRKKFNELTYQIKREYMREQNILLMHYDNLVDQSNGIIGKSTY